MATNKGILDILREIVAVQSDTGTSLECDMAEKLLSLFAEDEYFKNHPDCFGKYEFGDVFERPVIWALKKGRGKKVLIISGHMDIVEIESYGKLKPWALKPEELAKKISEEGMATGETLEHLNSGQWLFGRGTADMKGGLAVGIHEILNMDENDEAGILFVAVPDEENLSAGARGALGLINKIREDFDLEYIASVIPEPQFKDATDDFLVYNGSIGKMMPLIVAKGKLAHCGESFRGVNAAHIIADLVTRIDMNPELMTEDLGFSTQVPICQIVKDLKTTYDVSIPEYAATCVNLLFFGQDMTAELLAKIKKSAEETATDIMEKYNKAFEIGLSKGAVREDDRAAKSIRVMELRELEDELGGETEFTKFKQELIENLQKKITKGEINIQNASIEYIKTLLEVAGIEEPAIVVGIAPPYYPCVSNTYFDNESERLLEVVREVAEKKSGQKMRALPFFTGIGDCSYFVPSNPESERKLMKNVVLAGKCYDIPFEEAYKLNTPCFFIGPRGRAVHQWSERVYIKDLVETVPAIFKALRNV